MFTPAGDGVKADGVSTWEAPAAVLAIIFAVPTPFVIWTETAWPAPTGNPVDGFTNPYEPAEPTESARFKVPLKLPTTFPFWSTTVEKNVLCWRGRGVVRLAGHSRGIIYSNRGGINGLVPSGGSR